MGALMFQSMMKLEAVLLFVCKACSICFEKEYVFPSKGKNNRLNY